MSEFEFPQPLRLAKGAHPAGSGFACAMTVISWEQGGAITDMPPCAAAPLARMVQVINDSVCRHMATVGALTDNRGWGTVDLLCPPCSMAVLDLAHRTVGTSGATDEQRWIWVAELLTGEHGVLQHVDSPSIAEYIESAALLATQRAGGEANWRGIFGSSQMPMGAMSKGAQGLAAKAAYVCFGELMGKSPHEMGAAYVDVVRENPAAVLAAGHHAVDVWCALTDTTPTPVAPSTVIDAVDRMLVRT